MFVSIFLAIFFFPKLNEGYVKFFQNLGPAELSSSNNPLHCNSNAKIEGKVSKCKEEAQLHCVVRGQKGEVITDRTKKK